MYLQIVAALTLGWLVFGNFPDLIALAGMGLIALTGVTMAVRSRMTPMERLQAQRTEAAAEPPAAVSASVISPDGAPALPADATVPAAQATSAAPAAALATPLRAILLA